MVNEIKEKDAYYFSHDSNAHDDPKMIKLVGALGLEGSGIYWLLIELLRDQKDYKYPIDLLPDLAERYKSTKDKFIAVVNKFNLFEYDEFYFWSPSFLRRMAKREEIRQIRSNAGTRSGESRRLNSKKQSQIIDNKHLLNSGSTNDEQMLNKNEQGKERKGKEIEKEIKGNIKGNIKDKKNGDGKFYLPDWIPLETWDAFLEMRKSIKSVPTEKAKDLIIGSLEKLRGEGFSPVDVLNQSIRNNWKDVFAIKNQGGLNGANKRNSLENIGAPSGLNNSGQKDGLKESWYGQ